MRSHVFSLALASMPALSGAAQAQAAQPAGYSYHLTAALAIEAAIEAVRVCAEQQYWVTATVVDMDGVAQVVIRGDHATVDCPLIGNGVGKMDPNEIREALDRHWAAADADDFDAEHDIYRADALLEYPQSGERVRGRGNIQASRVAQPNAKRFKVRRIVGTGDLWVTEFVIEYDGRPIHSVSVMEFLDGKVARETQYFSDPFEPSPSRAQWVERMK